MVFYVLEYPFYIKKKNNTASSDVRILHKMESLPINLVYSPDRLEYHIMDKEKRYKVYIK